MQLKEWMEENNISLTEMAERLEITRQHVHQIVRGKSRPSKYLARDIIKVTAGKVSYADLPQEPTVNTGKKQREPFHIVSLKFRTELVDRIDSELKCKIGVTRKSWILEAIEQKFNKSDGCCWCLKEPSTVSTQIR